MSLRGARDASSPCQIARSIVQDDAPIIAASRLAGLDDGLAVIMGRLKRLRFAAFNQNLVG